VAQGTNKCVEEGETSTGIPLLQAKPHVRKGERRQDLGKPGKTDNPAEEVQVKKKTCPYRTPESKRGMDCGRIFARQGGERDRPGSKRGGLVAAPKGTSDGGEGGNWEDRKKGKKIQGPD